MVPEPEPARESVPAQRRLAATRRLHKTRHRSRQTDLASNIRLVLVPVWALARVLEPEPAPAQASATHRLVATHRSRTYRRRSTRRDQALCTPRSALALPPVPVPVRGRVRVPAPVRRQESSHHLRRCPRLLKRRDRGWCNYSSEPAQELDRARAVAVAALAHHPWP